MVCFISSILATISSPWAKMAGNLPALFKPGPNRGIFGGQESVVFFGELFNQFFVLVELFQVIDGHVWDAEFGGFINMGLVTEDANGKFWSSGVWELDGTGESLVLLWIVVFEHDLKLNGFSEFSVFVLAGLEHFGDLLVELISVDFRHIRSVSST